MGIVRMVGKWKANILYQIANAILRDYHEKKLDEDGVGELFSLCCQKCKDTGGGTGRKTEPQITETVLEFFPACQCADECIFHGESGKAPDGALRL